MTPTSNCRHTVTQGREGEVGSWCIDCGAKVWEVDDRECQHCANAQKLIGGWICRRYLMAITPNMHVTFRIVDGSCWQSAPSASAQQAEPIYQLQRADGSWIDQAEHSYKYNLSHGHAVRIVYAAPAPASPAALPECDTCNGFVHVHDATGEYRGECPHCATSASKEGA